MEHPKTKPPTYDPTIARGHVGPQDKQSQTRKQDPDRLNSPGQPNPNAHNQQTQSLQPMLPSAWPIPTCSQATKPPLQLERRPHPPAKMKSKMP